LSRFYFDSRVARSLLIWMVESPAKGRPVFSVTSETATNLSVANTPARSARADPSSAPDSFSALIDSNAADTAGNDRPAAPDRLSPQPRPDEPSAASDRPLPRDGAASSSAATNTPSQDAQPGAGQTIATDGSTDAAGKPAKLGVAKPGIVKTAVKDAASDIIATSDTATVDPAASPQAAASTVAAPAPVAVAIAAPVAATDAIVAPASPGNATEPLAIAAAAIATSILTVEASKPAAAAAQGAGDSAKPAPATAAPTTLPAETTPVVATPAAATTEAAVPVAAANGGAQASAPDAVTAPVGQPAGKADVVVEAGPALAAAAAVAPVATSAPKATPKPSGFVRSSDNAAPIKTGIAQVATDPSAPSPSSDAADKSVAPQAPVVDRTQKTDGGALDKATAEPVKTDAPMAATAAASPHEHRAAAALVQTDTSDPAQQASNAIQQPMQSTAAPVPAAAQLTVTAATAAVVPLNGLALQIAVTAQSGKSRFEIRLDPAELGRIDVRIDVDRHGQLTSHLTVEKPETLAMLRQDAPQLQRALDNAGFKTGDGGLQFSLRDQSSSGQNAGDGADRNAQRLIISEDDSIPAAVAGRTYGRMSGSGGGVDIRI
jgi:flagellar hook-length control protein FliK